MLKKLLGLLVCALALGGLAYVVWTQRAILSTESPIAARVPDATVVEPGRGSSSPVVATPDAASISRPPVSSPGTDATQGPSPLVPPITKPVLSPDGLVIPVAGITAALLFDTYTDARDSGRTHEAIDIMAPTGTPVLAVADGHIEKLFDSQRGGLTIYQFEPSGRYCYYYAHLQRYAPGLEQGQSVRRGEVIGYVGSTGNANPDAPHLHFAVFLLGPEREWWRGVAVNPYPLLGGS